MTHSWEFYQYYYATLPKSPEAELHHQIQFSITQKTTLLGGYTLLQSDYTERHLSGRIYIWVGLSLVITDTTVEAGCCLSERHYIFTDQPNFRLRKSLQWKRMKYLFDKTFVSVYLSIFPLIFIILSDSPQSINSTYIYIYIYIRGSLNTFPDFFRMDTFTDSSHMKL